MGCGASKAPGGDSSSALKTLPSSTVQEADATTVQEAAATTVQEASATFAGGEVTSGQKGMQAVAVAGTNERAEAAIDPLVLEVFALIDKNKDGSLSKAEILLALRKDADVRTALGIDSVQEGEAKAKFDAAFEAMDGDDNAMINVTELNEYLAGAISLMEYDFNRSAGKPSAPPPTSASLVDDDPELAAERARHNEITAESTAEIEAIFKLLDGDGDGTLDASELRAVVAEYEARPFNEKDFFADYDKRGPADGKIDLQVCASLRVVRPVHERAGSLTRSFIDHSCSRSRRNSAGTSHSGR